MNFEILVYKKENINSWFCNKIIDSLENIEDEIDFVLSNLHWGTRWSYYKLLKHKVPYKLTKPYIDSWKCSDEQLKLMIDYNIKDINLE